MRRQAIVSCCCLIICLTESVPLPPPPGDALSAERSAEAAPLISEIESAPIVNSAVPADLASEDGIDYGDVERPKNVSASIPPCIAEGVGSNAIVDFHVLKVDHSIFLQLLIRNTTLLRQKLPASCNIHPRSYLNWHIHDRAEFGGRIGIGPQECAPEKIGGHWDPTLACGPSSGNPICKTCDFLRQRSFTYQCDPVTHNAKDHFACELGDLSGKYGQLRVPSRQFKFTAFIIDGLDPIPACELTQKSLVVHCDNSLDAAFCLKLNVNYRSLGYYNSTVASAQKDIEMYAQELQEMAMEDRNDAVRAKESDSLL